MVKGNFSINHKKFPKILSAIIKSKLTSSWIQNKFIIGILKILEWLDVFLKTISMPHVASK
ncbi:MAG: hypothetical protein ACJAZX_001185 [Rickettsiales bacterium]|jgi:hypothetical protein